MGTAVEWVTGLGLLGASSVMLLVITWALSTGRLITRAAHRQVVAGIEAQVAGLQASVLAIEQRDAQRLQDATEGIRADYAAIIAALQEQARQWREAYELEKQSGAVELGVMDDKADARHRETQAALTALSRILDRALPDRTAAR